MELKTQAVDRLLEALSPALGAELERILQEARRNLEEEFERRLQGAVREAESASQRLAEVQLQQALTEARDQVRRQVTEELQTQFKRTLEENIAALRAQSDAERARLGDQLEDWRILADAHRQLSEAGSQAEMLLRFLKLAERFAAATAVYVARNEGLALWKARGDAAFPQAVSEKTVDPGWFFRTIVVRDKLIAAVCAAAPLKVEALTLLAASLERSVELFGVKLKTPAAMPKPAAAPGAAPLAQAAAAATGVVEAEPPVDDKSFAEARRLARLLVSEIKLYHEEEVKAGRVHSDLYTRLQSQLEAAREQYRQRAPAAVLGRTDYFHEEIVRILADNDESALGSSYPGPVK